MSNIISFADYGNLETDEAGAYCAAVIEYVTMNERDEWVKLPKTQRVEIEPTTDAATAVTRAFKVAKPIK